MKKILFTLLALSLALLVHANPNNELTTTAERTRAPVVYSYWAGWSYAPIPNFRFDGLFLSFALLLQGEGGSFYTDYSRSGNFHDPSIPGNSRYLWNDKWLVQYWSSGSRGYVSYGGASNGEMRSFIINASDAQLDLIAGEIKANIAKYSFDGVDLDIEDWWSPSRTRPDNERFATQLAKLVGILRLSMDNDVSTRLKPIMITVGITAADTTKPQDSYAGTMNAFFANADAMKAISDVNVMSYNTGIANFYSRLDIIGDYLTQFKSAGVPAEKLIVGVQPCEDHGNRPATPTNVITNLGQFIKQNNYGGLFLWGIGASELCGHDAWSYIKAMQAGLGIN
jgi:hypothetical protein